MKCHRFSTCFLTGPNGQKKTDKDICAFEAVRASVYESACVSTCVGEPYAAKWQPRGGERLVETECENWKERKRQKRSCI